MKTKMYKAGSSEVFKIFNNKDELFEYIKNKIEQRGNFETDLERKILLSTNAKKFTMYQLYCVANNLNEYIFRTNDGYIWK